MNILATIIREERKLEKRVDKLQRELEGLTAAAKALGNSAGKELDKAEKRVRSQMLYPTELRARFVVSWQF